MATAVSRFADIHSVLCWAHRRPHDHGAACHSTCPTCGGNGGYDTPTPPAEPDGQ